jgi:hypothetical protein
LHIPEKRIFGLALCDRVRAILQSFLGNFTFTGIPLQLLGERVLDWGAGAASWALDVRA